MLRRSPDAYVDDHARPPPARVRSARQPQLLVGVFGAFLVLIGGMAVGLAVVVTAHFSSAILNTTVAHDRALLRLWADTNLRVADVGAPLDEARRAELVGQLAVLGDGGEMLRLEVRGRDGEQLFGSTAGTTLPAPIISADLQQSLAGQATAQLLEAGQPSEALTKLPRVPLIREYLPLVTNDGEVAAVVALWRDASPVLRQLEATRQDVLLVTTLGAAALAVVLLFVFRAAQRRLTRQSAALVESARRDPLTGMLNHGAAVGALAERVELARGAGARLGLALIDIDSFRLLNETHGHDAGDRALLEVSGRLSSIAPAGTLVARYGPDEFMVVGPPMAIEVAEQAVNRLRTSLGEVALRFGQSEALPLTVSAGLATFPDAAQGVTNLLTAAANALTAAKTSGGDAVEVAGASGTPQNRQGSFDVLQGLVFAVDTKDRYTRRHSEDVARYAVFLGLRLGLSPAELEVLRVAGLLHDVGKVGIPDEVLRKPSALDADERRIVEQHVALGDMIVRDLPDLHAVRAGVRYHHERWDGNGYLQGLAAGEIPLVARILAVGDAFSAMTTTRPYRKAMSVSEALKRLGDSAGTQLDERLVTTFVEAMQSADEVPLPDEEASRPRLWNPRGVVA
jgi:diguanylate cyclase (GGDEF)-like protein